MKATLLTALGGALAGLAVVGTATTAWADIIEIAPGTNLGSEISALNPGDELVLQSGTYTLSSRLGITKTASAALPIIIRSKDGEVAVITRDASQNTLNVDNSQYVILRALEISGGSHGIRMTDSSFITVEDCHIHDTADVGLSANVPGSMYEGLIIRRNHIHHTGGTGEGMYLGCNYNGCTMYNSLIEGNYVHHTDSADVSQGDGIEIKDGSYNNIVRDNVIHDTGYPCILVYGTEGNPVNLIERNVAWNCGDHAIQAAADAVLRNNILLSANANGIHSQVHQNATPGNLEIVHNTVVMQNDAIRINAPNASVLIANNALYSQNGMAIRAAGTASYYTISGNLGSGSTQGVSSGFDNSGNIASDFVDVNYAGTGRNAFPAVGSALIGAGDPTYVAVDDFNGTLRQGVADVGAYRYDASGNPGWAITTDFKGSIAAGGSAGAGGVGGTPGTGGTVTGGAAGTGGSPGLGGTATGGAAGDGGTATGGSAGTGGTTTAGTAGGSGVAGEGGTGTAGDGGAPFVPTGGADGSGGSATGGSATGGSATGGSAVGGSDTGGTTATGGGDTGDTGASSAADAADEEGCGCRAAGSPLGPHSALAALLMAAGLLVRRRRR